MKPNCVDVHSGSHNPNGSPSSSCQTIKPSLCGLLCCNASNVFLSSPALQIPVRRETRVACESSSLFERLQALIGGVIFPSAIGKFFRYSRRPDGALSHSLHMPCFLQRLPSSLPEFPAIQKGEEDLICFD